jgi:hypothetical protein
MLGDDEGSTAPAKDKERNAPNVTLFAPRCTVVSYIGAETGNSF